VPVIVPPTQLKLIIGAVAVHPETGGHELVHPCGNVHDQVFVNELYETVTNTPQIHCVPGNELLQCQVHVPPAVVKLTYGNTLHVPLANVNPVTLSVG
jgi:hypothetical protein